jgi:hypothetical protein
MKVEIGAEAALFPEKEYVNGIFVAVAEATSPVKYKEEEQEADHSIHCE